MGLWVGWWGAKELRFPMADASVRRRGHGEDAIYIAVDKNRYIGAISLGFGPDEAGAPEGSPVSPSRRSATSSRLSTPSWTSVCVHPQDSRSTLRLRLGLSTACRVGRNGRSDPSRGADDLVDRNVAALVRAPAGHQGMPSEALTVKQA